MAQSDGKCSVPTSVSTAGRATERVPDAVLRAEERPRLRPVNLRAEELDLRFTVRVGPTGMVTWETNRCSLPAETLGYAATLHLFRDRVGIAAGPLRGRNRVSSLAAHRAGLLAAVSGKRGRMHRKRQQLLELGPPAERVLTELVHVRSRRWPDDVERLHELLQSCGSDALREAFREGARGPDVSVAAIVRAVHGRAPLFAPLPEVRP